MPTYLQLSSTPNNQCVVFDRIAGAWVGTWEADALESAMMFNYTDGDVVRGGVINADGTARRLLVDNCWDDDGTQEPMVLEAPLNLSGYESKSATVEVDVDCYAGSWLTRVEADGAYEYTGPYAVTPDPEKYRTFGAEDYEIDNINNDQLEPHREDYGLYIPDDSSASKVGLYVYEDDGVMAGVRQRWNQNIRVRSPARTMNIRVEGLAGSVAVHRIAVSTGVKPFGRGRRT
jgi:hypothetical protein